MRGLAAIGVLAAVALGCWFYLSGPGEELLEPPKPPDVAKSGVKDRPNVDPGMAPESKTAPENPPGQPSTEPELVEAPVQFETVGDSGVDFVHRSGINEDRFYPCANGSGLGSIDIDGDGLLDLYFATGNFFRPTDNQQPKTNRCYRNLGDWKFADVTDAAGVALTDYSAGVAVGDFDGDGFSDLYVTCVGPNQLFRNNGDGTFEFLEDSGTNHAGFAASAVFFDPDNDGLADLYVCNYGEWSIETNKKCDDGAGLRVFCAPSDIPQATDVLYRNNGDGTFRDASDELGDTNLRAQGAIAVDVNGDDFIDLYVGNDGDSNTLFTTGPDGTLEDVTATTATGFDGNGKRQAGMGVAAADVNRDGSVDLMVTNFEREHNTLYLGQDNALFEDRSKAAGVMNGAMPWVGWGVTLTDFDLDTWPDLVVVNGHVEPRLFEIGHGTEYEQPANFWVNDRGTFKLTTAAGDYFAGKHPARGMVVCDLDNDGDHDLVVGHQNQTPSLLMNTLRDRSGVELRFVGARTNRDGVGCKANVRGVAPPLSYQVKGGGSYLSANDNRVIVSLEKPTSIEVVWPGGRRSSTKKLEPGRRYVVYEPERGRTAATFELP